MTDWYCIKRFPPPKGERIRVRASLVAEVKYEGIDTTPENWITQITEWMPLDHAYTEESMEEDPNEDELVQLWRGPARARVYLQQWKKHRKDHEGKEANKSRCRCTSLQDGSKRSSD